MLPSPTAALTAGDGELMLLIKIRFKVSIENVTIWPKIAGNINPMITSYLSFSVYYTSVINQFYFYD